MASLVNIDVRQRLRVGEIRLSTDSMRQIMGFGVDSVKSRVTAGIGPDDSPAKPLANAWKKSGMIRRGYSNYARTKERNGLHPFRDLTLTGEMLKSFIPRRVVENTAIASVDGGLNWTKAGMNQKLQPWVIFSPNNRMEVFRKVREALGNNGRLLVARPI